MADPFTMLVTLYIRTDCRDEYLAALNDVLPPARQEPGCIYLYASESKDEPGKIVLLESWRDSSEYIKEVLHRPYFKRYLRISEACYAAPRTMILLNPLGP